MENTDETHCTCSLVHFTYQIGKVPSTPNHFMKSKKLFQTAAKKPKVSLSRSTSGLVLDQTSLHESDGHSKGTPGSRGGYQKCNIYEGNIERGGQNLAHLRADEPKLRKKYMNAQVRTEKAPQKYNSDLQKTQNTAFDNSLEYLQRKNADKKRVADMISFSFFNEDKSDSKINSSAKCLGKEYREKQSGGKENSFYQKPGNLSIFYEEGRRIKTLKQLEFRNAESSGGGTSENHVSMIMSITEAKSEELKGLDKLARKSSSFTRLPKTTHDMA